MSEDVGLGRQTWTTGKMKAICLLPIFINLMGFAWTESSWFIATPQSQTIVEGEPVTFHCQASAIKDVRYTWLHNGRLMTENSSRVYQLDSELHIEAVRRDSDVGDYVCVATSGSSGARQASPPATLTVIWIQTASVQLLSNEPHQLELKCQVEANSGGGVLEIEWFRNSQKLTAFKNIQLLDNKLIIQQPQAKDNGLYRCVASNKAGRAISTKGFALQWPDPGKANGCMPRLKNKNYGSSKGLNEIFLCRGKRGDKLPKSEIKILKAPASHYQVKETEAVELPCLYEVPAGKGAVHLRWRKDGKTVRHIELGGEAALSTPEPLKDPLLRDDSRLSLVNENGSLIFSSVLASDAGLYSCQLEMVGYQPVTSDAADLQVIEQLKFVPQPTSKNLELGTVGKVHCKAQGTPTPTVKWMKDGSASHLPPHVDDINGTLMFKNVSTEHIGNYTCLASNTQGQINATVSVNVVIAPKFTKAPHGSIESHESGVAMFHCQAIGDPKPTIQWDKDLKYLSENNTDAKRFKFLENGTLIIQNVQMEDDGLFGCTIGNSAGLKREEVRFVVKAAEEPEGFLITRAVLITMTVAFAYIILVVGLMIWCRLRRQARKARLNELNKENLDALESGKTKESDPCLPNGGKKSKRHHGGSGNEAQKSDDTTGSHQSRNSKKSSIFDQLALPRSSISELIQIGRGDFGDVFVGKIKAAVVAQLEDKDNDTEKHSNSENGHSNGNGTSTTTTSIEKRRSKTSMDDIEEIKEEQEENSHQEALNMEEHKLVLVKALNKVKDDSACQEFKRQIEMFRALNNKGVVQLFGLCREKDPHYMVLEYTDWGDLKQFLLATAGKVNTSTNSSSPPPLKTSQVLAVAYQIARGMDAIYRARFIHKDLATRNCVISSDFVVKVSYPALCKDKYSREYFKHRNSLLPVRWLAPECIQDDDYSTKSDIFAFGVLVWELFNQATKMPFEELSNEEVVSRSQNGKLEWECADGTPESLKEILLSCWNQNPKMRPSFSQLSSAFTKAIQSLEE